MPGGEVIQLSIGQAGVQIASAIWELFCLEHGISPNGLMVCDHAGPDSNSFRSVFQEHFTNGFYPRAMLIDMEPTCIDEIRTGFYRRLFHPDMLISGKEDCANNYARGYYSYGREFNDVLIERIRHLVEPCNGLQGFMLLRSLGGGCGSGFGALVLERLRDNFGRKSKISLDVFPSPQLSTSTVEPYNAILTTHSSIAYADVSFICDNQALYGICKNELSIQQPTYTNVNHIIAQVVSGLTCPLRFEGSLNVELKEFQTNLVPYPRIHFPLLMYSPIHCERRAQVERVTVGSMVTGMFDERTQMVKCSVREGKLMALSFLFRGDVTPNDINMAMDLLKGDSTHPGKVQFANWAPTAFKIGLCHRPPYTVPGSAIASQMRAAVGMMNTTAIRQPWKRLLTKFDKMLEKRAFVHHYVGEGMEEQEFRDARDNLQGLYEEYKALEKSDVKAAPGAFQPETKRKGKPADQRMKKPSPVSTGTAPPKK